MHKRVKGPPRGEKNCKYAYALSKPRSFLRGHAGYASTTSSRISTTFACVEHVRSRS
jgi:hypothetical protein